MKRVSLKKTVLMSLLLSTTMPTAHAGISDAINNYFTFREEQKPLVAPNRDLPPLEIMTPSYDQRRAKDWSDYYTRNDLEAVQHLDNSSRVMRKRVLTPDEMEAMRKAAYQQTAGQNGYPHAGVNPYGQQTAGDYDRIVRRDAANRAAESMAQNNFYIGEPGTTPDGNYVYPQNGHAGLKAQIGEPKYKWNEVPEPNGYATPREGDYDYQQRIKHARAEDISKEMMSGQGYELARSSGYGYAPYNEDQDLINRGGSPMRARPVQAANTMQANSNAPIQITPLSEQDLMITERDMVELNTQQPYAQPIPIEGGGQEMYNGHSRSHAQIDLPDRYTVEPNDTLSHISGKDVIYGDWKLWPLIYDANRNQIQDPDLIRPGQDLGIPRDQSETEEEYARRRAVQKNAPFDFYDGQ